MSRSLVWRGALLKQAVEEEPLEVARCAGGFGAARQYKIQAEMVVTDTCASRRTDGAARKHGKLCRFLHSLREISFTISFSLISYSSTPHPRKLSSSTPFHNLKSYSTLNITQKSLSIDSIHPITL
ncbi:hypothetical protein A2U01_0038322 [Trifolium medium]|uniref:Uncharacterized protein n=1 Tax=Trifolium medium TaxID=97028 RepID=A0A392Q1Q7_9FABA|nr:hypothetical protein [Trifolium medium]